MHCFVAAIGFAGEASSASDGKTLAQRYCGSCHLVPATDVLPADSWPHVLDLMGLYFGYDDGGLLARSDPVTRQVLFDVERYPAQPSLDRPQWQALRAYYENAPGAAVPAPPPRGEPLQRFETRILNWERA